MKKTLILASLLAFTTTSALANTQSTPCPLTPEAPKPPVEQGKMVPPPPNADKMAEKRAKFEDKLQLTEEQKAQAKAIRLKGHEEMKPIFEQMKAKKTQIDTIKKSSITEEEKAQQIAPVKKELKALKQQARDLRIKNMQEFESILTADQKKTLAKMKKEGKKNFKKHHPKRPPCNCKPKCNCQNK